MKNAIKLISFDLDDTLWPCGPTIVAAEKALYRWLQDHVPAITRRYDIAALRQQRIDFMQQHQDLAHDMSKLRIASLQALGRELELGEAWVNEAFEIFYEARQKVTLYDDVAPVLDQLGQKYRLAAVTNGNASIEKTAISHWFEFSVTAAEVGQQKPHPAFFATVLDRAGVAAPEVLHIGDDPHRDIFGASQAGMRTVWVNRTHQVWEHAQCQADGHIGSLEELPDVVEQLES